MFVDISYDLNELSADGDQIQQPVVSKLGAPMKEWEDLGPHQKRLRKYLTRSRRLLKLGRLSQ